MMDNNPQEWYVAYHGIRLPNMHQVITSIMKNGIMVGFNNAYATETCRKTGLIIKNGIYCTPYIRTAEGYTRIFEFNGGPRRLAL